MQPADRILDASLDRHVAEAPKSFIISLDTGIAAGVQLVAEHWAAFTAMLETGLYKVRIRTGVGL